MFAELETEVKILLGIENYNNAIKRRLCRFNNGTQTIKIKFVVNELGIHIIALTTTQTNKANNCRTSNGSQEWLRLQTAAWGALGEAHDCNPTVSTWTAAARLCASAVGELCKHWKARGGGGGPPRRGMRNSAGWVL